MSTRFPLFNKLRGGAGGEKEEVTPIETENEEVLTKEEEEAAKEEVKITNSFEVARNYFIENKLKGNIYASYSFLAFTNSLSCDVDGTDETSVPMVLDEAKMSHMEKAMLKSVRSTIRRLTSRAMAYKNKPYREDLTLSCGFGLTTPMLGLASFYVTVSATVHTLLEARDRQMAEGK